MSKESTMFVASSRIACCAAVAAAASAMAQPQPSDDATEPAEAAVSADPGWIAQLDHAGWSGPHARTLAFAADELGQERIVKGAPYCADAVHESVQPLADGNRIVHKQVTRLCRDGEGRTRQEIEHDGHRRVYLRDPVAREAWLLDPERKGARRIGAGRLDAPGDGAAWREYGERMRDWARSFRERLVAQPAVPPLAATPPVPPVPPDGPMTWSGAQPVVIVSGEPARRLAQTTEAQAVRPGELQVLRIDVQRDDRLAALPPVPPMPELPPMPAPLMQRLPGFAPRGPGVLTPLGSKEVEGLRVDGERTTWTIEPGRMGNEKPIVITREVWTSPELLLTVQSREFDPRSGETTYRLSKMRRGEPDAALMKVPADYDSGRGDERRQRPAAPPASGRG
jgi:hypothetical protein